MTNNNTISFVISIVTSELTKLILQKYGLKVCVILFGFYSTRYKVYIHLPCINTQRRRAAPFTITPIISSSDHQTAGMYQVSAHSCEGDHNSSIICLLQPSHTIRYYNQSVLVIFPYLNIFVFSITVLISFREVPWYGLVY